MRMRLSLIFCILILTNYVLLAQYQINGDAIETTENCFELTQPTPSQAGSVWNLNQISLAENFVLSFDIFLGCGDTNGADGIYFVLQPISTSIGGVGGNMGFGGIVPSIGIEFDTYLNGMNNDPTYDHIAIQQNGSLIHGGLDNLVPPTQILESSANIEDCTWHDVRFTWDVATQTLEAYVDCELRISYSSDIVNEIFGGDPMVYWGFTAGTGALFNLQAICLEYVSFLDGISNDTTCAGQSVSLNAPLGFETYSWTPAETVQTPDAANTIVNPNETTTYTISMTDDCGYEITDSLTVFVYDILENIDLGPDIATCVPDTISFDVTTQDATGYFWSFGALEPVVNLADYDLEANEPISIIVFTQCQNLSDTILVETINNPTASYTFNTCNGQAVNAYGQDFEPNTTTNISVATPNGCDSLITITVNNGSSTTDTINFTACGGQSINFNGNELLSNTNTQYSFTNQNGCDSIVIVTVAATEFQETVIKLPTAFSPNGDGINDDFCAFVSGDILSADFQIYNRWGQAVFTTSELGNLCWNGQLEGTAAPIGVYAWFISVDYVNCNGDTEQQLLKGNSTLIR